MSAWPSGESDIASGKSPIVMCRPAGEIRQPFGNSVTPPPVYPGREADARCATDTPVASITRIATPHVRQTDRAVMLRKVTLPGNGAKKVASDARRAMYDSVALRAFRLLQPSCHRGVPHS